MTTITFDTLKCVKRLKESGFSEAQSEALTESLKEMQEQNLEDLATKRDLKDLEFMFKRDLKELELGLKSEMLLLKWMLGFVLAGIVSLILKSFFV